MDEICNDRIRGALGAMFDGIDKQMTEGTELLLLNTILMGIMVSVGICAPRYRLHPVIGVLFKGSAALFLPIISKVASNIATVRFLTSTLLQSLSLDLYCPIHMHFLLVFVWTGLVVVIGINSSVLVTGDAREGKNVDPSMVLTIKAIWTAYLTASTMFPADPSVRTTLVHLLVIMFAKLLLKHLTFYKARRSFEFGRNPRLIAGYMSQLEQELGAEIQNPPALVVMGEDTLQVEKQQYGYSFKGIMTNHGDVARENNSNRLVRMDKVWQLNDDVGVLQKLIARPKDLCLSFALFKLLRCRFAKYTVLDAGFMKVDKFFRDAFFIQGADHNRVFELIADELSFIHDYYYSSLPICYSHHLLPILSIALSLYSISYCIYLVALIIKLGLVPVYMQYWVEWLSNNGQTQNISVGVGIQCSVEWWSNNGQTQNSFDDDVNISSSDLVPIFLVIPLLVLAEVRDIVSYMCSNWTKLALVYHHINQARWQRPPVVQQCIVFVLKYCKCGGLLNSWNDKMNQCSILPLYPRKIPILRRFLRLRDQKKKIKVPGAVKATIFAAIQRCLKCEQDNDGAIRHVRPPSPPIPVSPEWKGGLAHDILVWHISTSLVELRHPPKSSDPEDEHKISATHLSRYCAYLVAYRAELLPGDEEWCKSLYAEVRKSAYRILSPCPGVDDDYEQLLKLLCADDDHEVLKDGARLAKQLVDSDTGWDALACFWAEMIMYVAPSENLDGHAEAIARGGELITLLWAMLAHAGIVDRHAAGRRC